MQGPLGGMQVNAWTAVLTQIVATVVAKLLAHQLTSYKSARSCTLRDTLHFGAQQCNAQGK